MSRFHHDLLGGIRAFKDVALEGICEDCGGLLITEMHKGIAGIALPFAAARRMYAGDRVTKAE